MLLSTFLEFLEEPRILPEFHQNLQPRMHQGKNTDDKMKLHKMTAGTVAVIVEYDMKYHPLFVYARLIFHLYCPLTLLTLISSIAQTILA